MERIAAPPPHLVGLATGPTMRKLSGTHTRNLLTPNGDHAIRDLRGSAKTLTPSSDETNHKSTYGTQSLTHQSSESTQGQTGPSFVAAKRRWMGVLEIICNVIGTAGFVIGSFLWCTGTAVPGTIIFAVSCCFCGTSCTIYACKFFTAQDSIGVYALTQQAVGCFMFTAASVAFLMPPYETIALIGFYTASTLFLTGCILTQVQCLSLTGVLAPVWPTMSMDVLPTSLLNTVGSALFTIGSIGLFYPGTGQAFGAWCYAIGSIFFLFASWGDATVWWKIGVTQSEHQQVTSTLETDYAAIKFH